MTNNLWLICSKSFEKPFLYRHSCLYQQRRNKFYLVSGFRFRRWRSSLTIRTRAPTFHRRRLDHTTRSDSNYQHTYHSLENIDKKIYPDFHVKVQLNFQV